MLIAPLLVTLALKINSLVGIEQAPNSLAVVAATGAVVAMVGNPLFGRLSDRTSSRLGMRRPWMVIGLVGGSLGTLAVALAPSIAVVLVAWCVAQLFFNALLAVQVAVLPDQVPVAQRGLVSGVLGVVCPRDRRVLHPALRVDAEGSPACRGGQAGLVAAGVRRRTFYFRPRKSPDFAWVFASRFTFVLAYAFLTIYQAYYLLERIGTAEADVPEQIFLGTPTQSVVLIAASLIGGRLSDRSPVAPAILAIGSGSYGVLYAVAGACALIAALAVVPVKGAR